MLEVVPRSILCVPSIKDTDILFKRRADFDAILFDLEDSIPSLQKEEARQLSLLHLKKSRLLLKEKMTIVRINSVKTKEGVLDLMNMIDKKMAPDILSLPKVEDADEILFVKNVLGHDFKNIQIHPIIETSKGLLKSSSILKADPCVTGLVFGAADFASDIGCELNWSSLFLYRSELVKMAKMHRIQVIDAPFFDYKDSEGLEKEVYECSKLGFTGKIAIHPDQIFSINNGFLPSPESVQLSREILHKAKTEKANIFSLKGRMIGPPIIENAKKILEKYSFYTKVEQHESCSFI